MKRIIFAVSALLFSCSVFANTPDNVNPISADDFEIVFTVNGSTVDCNDGVSYEVYWYSALEEYVVKFYNNTSSYASISYQYRVKDSATSSHWRDGHAGCVAGGTSDYNPAGEWGEVRNVEYN